MIFKKYRSLLVIGVIGLYLYFKGAYIPHFCLFEKIIDLKCPFCGITRSFEEIIKLNFLSALKINFMSIVLLTFLIIKPILNYFNLFKAVLKADKVFFGLCILQFFILNQQVFSSKTLF